VPLAKVHPGVALKDDSSVFTLITLHPCISNILIAKSILSSLFIIILIRDREGDRMEEEEIRRIKERKLREMEEKLRAKKEEGKKKPLDHPITVTDDTFKEVIRKYPFLVVDCWATWCPPCLILSPIIDELAKEFAGKVVFGKMNVDDSPRTAAELGIMAIPTLLFYKNGKLVDNVVGVMPKSVLEDKIRRLM